MCGFNDELYQRATPVFESDLQKKAYKLGAQHAIVGDDVRSVDYLSNEEILGLIKEE